jgi:hypothetical protein
MNRLLFRAGRGDTKINSLEGIVSIIEDQFVLLNIQEAENEPPDQMVNQGR